MRSYYEHLESAKGTDKAANLFHPILRSSAIFPVFNSLGISSRILFMGYWILKRNIKEILAVVTLRALLGQVLNRSSFSITEPKTYRIELQEQLSLAGLSPTESFTGSLEIEFYSTVHLAFPYPAVVINYYGPAFSSVVHTAQRVYNDFEDRQRNSQTQVAESGFNIYADEQHEPFIGLINGPQAVKESDLYLECYNLEGESMHQTLSLGKLEAYETRLIYFGKELELQKFLKGQVGAAKATFHVDWIFPRLLVGNFSAHLPALSITHTYYDTSNALAASNYWPAVPVDYYAASLMIPVCTQDTHFTNIYFYPIYSPSQFAIDLEFYSATGECLLAKKNALYLNPPLKEIKQLKLKDLLKSENLTHPALLSARLIARTVEDSRLPARIKLGLDIGFHPFELPCNICTNLQPYNPAFDKKPISFRWAPIIQDQPHCSIWIMNSHPSIIYTQAIVITLHFYREQDAHVLKREYSLAPHGFEIIYPHLDQELVDFFNQTVGWFTVATPNPYTTTYYFNENASGIVGGDHGF